MHSAARSTVPASRPSTARACFPGNVHLEPVPRLEWSLAAEAHPSVAEATTPSALRCSWLHRAPEEQVLTLFRKLDGAAHELPAPWWLPALDRGEISTRTAAFDLEDDVHRLLTSRPGWVFVPWAGVGETGYWEYGPSDREPRKMPTTVALTNEHPGWINVVAAHADVAPLPLPVGMADGLLVILPQVEAW